MNCTRRTPTEHWTLTITKNCLLICNTLQLITLTFMNSKNLRTLIYLPIFLFAHKFGLVIYSQKNTYYTMIELHEVKQFE